MPEADLAEARTPSISWVDVAVAPARARSGPAARVRPGRPLPARPGARALPGLRRAGGDRGGRALDPRGHLRREARGDRAVDRGAPRPRRRLRLPLADVL